MKAPLLVIFVSISTSLDLPFTGIKTGSSALEEGVPAAYKLYSPGIHAAYINPTATVGKKIKPYLSLKYRLGFYYETSTQSHVSSCAFPSCLILVLLDEEKVLLKNL